MPINVNGTGITDVKVNGVSMNEVKVNGVVVWTRNLDLNLLNDAASAYTSTAIGALQLHLQRTVQDNLL